MMLTHDENDNDIDNGDDAKSGVVPKELEKKKEKRKKNGLEKKQQ